MATGKRVPLPTKIEAVKDFASGNWNETDLRKKYKVTIPTIQKWKRELANGSGNGPGPEATTFKDVLVFLERAESAILKGKAKRISAGESYAMLALTTLRGG